MGRMLIGALLAALLAGCATEEGRRIQQKLQEFFSPSRGNAALAAGVRQYDDGQYPEAARSLATALDRGLSDKDQVTAHKYLAFIHCSLNRERQCREEFRKALAVDPSLELAPAEAGHPVWGPIFRSLKAAR